MSLHGKTAIVSGGAGDIGGAAAEELARRGADVAVGDITDPDRDRMARIESAGRKHLYSQLDVSNPDAVVAWVDEVESRLGLPDIVVASAAVATFKNLRNISFEEWRREFDVNVNGYFYLARTVANRLEAKKRGGRIVLVGSAAANGITLGAATYCITKSAVRKLAETLAAQYAKSGILVCDVSPGVVDAGLSGAAMREDPSIRTDSEAVVPVGELSLPGDIAFQIGHLCEPECRHITGSTLYVDGGMSLKIIHGYGDEESPARS